MNKAFKVKEILLVWLYLYIPGLCLKLAKPSVCCVVFSCTGFKWARLPVR